MLVTSGVRSAWLFRLFAWAGGVGGGGRPTAADVDGSAASGAPGTQTPMVDRRLRDVALGPLQRVDVRALDPQLPVQVRPGRQAGAPHVGERLAALHDLAHLHVYRREGPRQVLTDKDVLQGEEVIPGFSCPVAELFKGI